MTSCSLRRAAVSTAFSTSVREAGDLSAGVFDTEGRMIAQAVTGTPGHVNTMAAAVGHFIDDIGPERIYPGDVYNEVKIKRSINRIAGALDQSVMDMDADQNLLTRASDDMAEAVRAYLAKEEPEFKGD